MLYLASSVFAGWQLAEAHFIAEKLGTARFDVEQPQINMVFADGLDRLLAVTSFPTVVVLDRTGKIVYRSEGYGDDNFEKELAAAIHQAM